MRQGQRVAKERRVRLASLWPLSSVLTIYLVFDLYSFAPMMLLSAE